MKRAAIVAFVGAVVSVSACRSDGFPVVRSSRRLTVELKDQDRVAGSRLQPLKLTINEAQPFRITVRALAEDGEVDASYNGFVRISAKPGAVERIEAPDADGRSVKLTNGVSPEIEVRLANAYGMTYILADDIGYQPLNPLAPDPPLCGNGLDDDGDGTIDFPADDGCAFANDNTEEGASYSQGASAPIFYQLPRVADVRGLKCNEAQECSGNGITPYPKEPVAFDTGYHDQGNGRFAHDFDMVVTRIASSGFFVTDRSDSRGGFNSIFAFNFNAPPRMRVCDRIRTFAGTANEFFGLTQVSYPTWTLEEWDPQARPCLVPEPQVLTAARCAPGARDCASLPSPANPEANLLPLTASLVRVLSAENTSAIKVTPKFGPENMPETNGTFFPGENATNCDLNKDGSIDFAAGSLEAACANTCSADPECTEYSNFLGRSVFRLTVTDLVSGNSAAIQADATASAEFKPLERRGQALKAFSGTLTYFSGGAQFTIEARCKDDIVIDAAAQPLPSDKACVSPRTTTEETPE